MQQKNKRKLSIATVFVILSAYGFIFNIERSVAETDLSLLQQKLDRNQANIELSGIMVAQLECMVTKTLRTPPEQAKFCIRKFRKEIANAERKIKQMDLEIANAATQDPYTNNANAAARQRYLMDNQTGEIPFARTREAIKSQREVDRINNQIRAERGMAESQRRQRDAAACMYGNSGCK